jgi:hypothetical protein
LALSALLICKNKSQKRTPTFILPSQKSEPDTPQSSRNFT